MARPTIEQKLTEDAHRLDWCLHNPEAQCNVKPSKMTLDDLATRFPGAYREFVDDVQAVHEFIDDDIQAGNEFVETRFDLLGFPYREHFNCVSFITGVKLTPDLHWCGLIREGAVVIEIIKRQKSCDAPYISEITQAAYSYLYHINTLKYVFFTYVCNEQTLLYLKSLHEDCNRSNEHKVWERGNKNYWALLGTPLGKVVTALLLGAFPRGTRHVARIITWLSPDDFVSSYSMEFDIEAI
ncbi:hypothetical protein N7495_004679 [Penicillium taxi]|uniref:uncharacterized protein n=1 Tax=Penicillium taxi TaxID=168475 RepID=UPI0025459BE2|nr:uncharacterized protein N7495_004679 [Penicillium taxi]KAJ5899935.1 hypothetical protein N7495_004679 [Penicillium taxi]